MKHTSWPFSLFLTFLDNFLTMLPHFPLKRQVFKLLSVVLLKSFVISIVCWSMQNLELFFPYLSGYLNFSLWDNIGTLSSGAFGQTFKNAVIRTVLLEFCYKNCPSPGEPFQFAFAHKSGTFIGTDVTQPSATVTCYCSAAFNNKTREK